MRYTLITSGVSPRAKTTMKRREFLSHIADTRRAENAATCIYPKNVTHSDHMMSSLQFDFEAGIKLVAASTTMYQRVDIRSTDAKVSFLCRCHIVAISLSKVMIYSYRGNNAGKRSSETASNIE